MPEPLDLQAIRERVGDIQGKRFAWENAYGPTRATGNVGAQHLIEATPERRILLHTEVGSSDIWGKRGDMEMIAGALNEAALIPALLEEIERLRTCTDEQVEAAAKAIDDVMETHDWDDEQAMVREAARAALEAACDA